MRELTDYELEQLHRVLLQMMKDFDGFCRENNIQYFLAGGTLLGAIRHKGFIPWDDDVDLMMLRSDYEKLCNIPKENFPNHMFLQTVKTDQAYHGDMPKIRLNGTVYKTEFTHCISSDMHQGIFLDIFIHDKTAMTKQGQKLHIFFTTLFRSLVFHKWENSPMQYYGKHQCICKIATMINRLFPMSVWKAGRELLYKFFDKSKCPFLYDGMGQHLQHGAFPAMWLEKAVFVNFEDYSFPVPWKYHEYLTYSYGEYMKIPKTEHRKKHKIAVLDFGNGHLQKE